MAPPTYADLGKSAKDLFSKGYNYGEWKLEAKTTTDSGVEFTTTGSHSDKGIISGSLETKYKYSDLGLTFKEKWNTSNVLFTEIAIEDQLVKGLKLEFNTSFAPQTGTKSGKIKSSYKMDYLNLGCDVDFVFAGPTINAAAVLGYKGWLGGYQMSFDTSKSKLTKNNFAVGYEASDFTIHTNVNDGAEYCGSIYHKIRKDLEGGVKLSWSSAKSTSLELGTKYKIDSDSSVSAKVDSNSRVGLGYTTKLRDGMKLTLSALVDGKNFNAGGHQLGLGLNFEA
ncbi:non-selective voltage-gated ion channel VDAC2-like [Crassostrea virginica]|uniref:Voltage-dependent anion-selective channel protein 2-like n=1 Tax=Crassostrea virginica TaxID=6565 RepID=A0A8B8CK35_CRAVI|nr:voltage-dependent anion-selective channel protein 2-like [Crassostrea virginica]|mmetsp:Transcript_42385/g.68013  ORF Transcript_42385/g.68013 Transcript_42385/m.68013 type:complete len:281 (+) Transcript_42385:44-886(+)|eukprot:CAMPEP_0203748570 /NCGR_PEP_ID=MMETSP0098-20131031/3418_1 /ASSEMBLY_ACC=CAM_ASM_000208 /TAXON_ID=96639 /ORGANISM=" , Strain NY0313808BC1" /LENGTH=280 /DNA_ID=CAMNT_0050637351 /DNA_START=19 /DNA_END=861 /DNA_ORIENTATION=-